MLLEGCFYIKVTVGIFINKEKNVYFVSFMTDIKEIYNIFTDGSLILGVFQKPEEEIRKMAQNCTNNLC